MRTVIALALLLICGAAYGQDFMLKGDILDETGQPLSSVASVLLDPADSTLLYFSVTGNNGRFEIGNIKKGVYLLQVSLLGYNTYYRSITAPSPDGGDLGSLVMTPKVFNMNGVTVTGERIPIKILDDTLEFNAKAFRVKPDAVAEDLIKKMPGIEVDRAGNIKAMGEDVDNVLVDGKEFFGNDPKVATRNLPADVIDKVQLFDKQSDESEFTGIDDGERNPTLNFVLDENKKNGIFGDVLGGAGTGGSAEASGKVYRFTKKTQFAALGMFNNINQFGFSLGDYINFSGGISNFSTGDGHAVIGGQGSFPVNFGQPVYGSGSNGAAGINFSVSNPENDRLFISYLGNGSRRKLSETSLTKYYVPEGSFNVDEAKKEDLRDTTQRLNFGLRKKIGGRQNIILNGGLSYNSASNPLTSYSESFLNDIKVNGLERNTSELTSRLSGNADASWLLKINEGKSVFKFSGRINYSGSRSETRFFNTAEYLDPYNLEIMNQFYDVNSSVTNSSGSVSLTQRITRRSFIDISVGAGYGFENMKRDQGDIEGGMESIDSLSPVFDKNERYLRPGIAWKLKTVKSLLSVALVSNIGDYTSTLNNDEDNRTSYFFLNPRVSWELNYRSGRRLMADYSTSVNTPRASQLLPVVNNINTLSLFYGNRELEPEYIHNARVSWWLFDQFSFTTLLTGINMSYTRNKIGYNRSVNEDLGQLVSLLNVKDDWNGGGNIDFSTPLKPLGITVNINLNENYNRGLSMINGIENVSSSFNHGISLTINNRKKEKWDLETGAALTVTDSKYSIQNSLNNIYNNISWFAGIMYTPNKKFNFSTSADITSYSARSFRAQQVVPLIGAGVSYYFLKNQRGVLSLTGVDLLNRNTGIERMSEMNYLVERNSSIIGRYIMLSFKYRLNKIGDGNGGIDIQVRKR